MSRIVARIDPDFPAIQRKTARYERKLEQALSLARKRDRRCGEVLKRYIGHCFRVRRFKVGAMKSSPRKYSTKRFAIDAGFAS